MRPGRELDTSIAQQVFGHFVFVKNKELYERAPKGDRPLRKYSKEIAPAWEVAEKMKVSLIPVENNQWFALVGGADGWKSPADYITYLQTGKFVEAGAAVGDEVPLIICLAALKAVEARKLQSQGQTGTSQGQAPHQTH
jgi:hypothetical protein